jgi:hypothetical protein
MKSSEALVAARSRAAQPNWFHFITLSGDEGRRWVDEYRQPERRAVAGEISRALELLRKRQVVIAGDLLKQLAAPLAETPSVTVRLVLERMYHPVLAYYHYCAEDFDAAEEALEAACEALRKAILMSWFLVPLADSFIDFTFQRARIARNRRRWSELRCHLQTVHDMMHDRLPFCRLADGTAIDLTALRRFYGSIPLSDEDLASVSYVLEDEVLESMFELTAADIYCQIGLLIPYP